MDYVNQEWQDDPEPWGRKPVAKLNYKVTLVDGSHLALFKNMDHDGWYRL